MLTSAQKDGLGVALNEASLLDVTFTEVSRTARVVMRAFNIGADENRTTADVTLVLRPVGRLIGSLREGRWDDPRAAVTPFALKELSAVVRSFGSLPIYGWEFLDTAEKELALWGSRLSLDWRAEMHGGDSHSLVLFQEGPTRHLDLCLFFDELDLETSVGQAMALDEFIAGGQKWWEAFRAEDPRATNSGMFPLQ